MSRDLRPHIAWTALGAAMVACLWYAWSLPGGVGMFAGIALAFVMWSRMGPRGSWMALVVLGLGMGGILGWQALSGSRCPAGDTKVFLKANKPPVGCSEIRMSAASMSALFLLVAGIGIGAPIYARGMEPDDAAEHAAD